MKKDDMNEEIAAHAKEVVEHSKEAISSGVDLALEGAKQVVESVLSRKDQIDIFKTVMIANAASALIFFGVEAWRRKRFLGRITTKFLEGDDEMTDS